MFVETIEGRKRVALLKVGSELICRDQNNKRVSSKIKKFDGQEVDKFLKVTLYGGEEIDTFPDQKVFVEGYNYYDEKSDSIKMKKIDKWMTIGDLVPGHVIASARVIKDFMFEGSQSNEVLAIEKKYGRKILNYIELEKYHNYFSDENGILMHNGPLLALTGYYITKGVCYLGLGAAVSGAVTAGAIASTSASPVVASIGVVSSTYVGSGVASITAMTNGSVALCGVATTIGGVNGAAAVGAATGSAVIGSVSAGTTAAAVVVAAKIEAASWTVFNFLNWLPTW